MTTIMARENRLDLVGATFGRLKVLEFAGTKKGYSQWRCECECGNQFIAYGTALNSGNTKSCGCLQKEKASKGGIRSNPHYQIWIDIKYRCYNPSRPDYKYYGGEGKTMWSEWRDNCKLFLNYIDCHLGPKPGPEYSIDRIDNNGNYEPYNLRWNDPKGQRDNQRPRKSGKSGYPWVHKQRDRFIGLFVELGRKYYCGIFGTPEEAYQSVCAKRVSMGLKV